MNKLIFSEHSNCLYRSIIFATKKSFIELKRVMMNDSFVKINSSFVSERINKIRFVEEKQPQLEPTNFFSASSESKNNFGNW